jgi:hypothetical protein
MDWQGYCCTNLPHEKWHPVTLGDVDPHRTALRYARPGQVWPWGPGYQRTAHDRDVPPAGGAQEPPDPGRAPGQVPAPARRAYERDLRVLTEGCLNRMGHRKPLVPHGPVYLAVEFLLRQPKTGPMATSPWPLSPPDTDHLMSPCWNAWQGLLYHEDANTVNAAVEKRWATGQPGIRVAVADLAGITKLHPSGRASVTLPTLLPPADECAS